MTNDKRILVRVLGGRVKVKRSRLNKIGEVVDRGNEPLPLSGVRVGGGA